MKAMKTGSTSMLVSRSLAVLGLLALLVVGILGLIRFGGFGPIPCPMDGYFSLDTPPGWSASRDAYNGCAWTLFNAEGARAPDELYDKVPFDPPGPRFLYAPRLLAIGLVVGSLVGTVRVRRSANRTQAERANARDH
jgi:hypothetical protein